MKKVLVVEDEDVYFEKINKILSGKVEVVRFTRVYECNHFFEENLNIAAAIIDACINNETLSTVPFVEKLSRSGLKIIIASSGTPRSNDELLAHGATHKVDEKEDAAKLTLQLLGF
ncbi:MAG: hypothetical protein PHT40_01220 [Patescibacteria group bacterium]|nr:hypothetical protein [Patescibacteria group bacterium]